MRYTQVDEVGQILREGQSPFRVVDVLSKVHLVPGPIESLKERLAVCHWSVWSGKQKLGLSILGFDH
jgi:hypothetical protein